MKNRGCCGEDDEEEDKKHREEEGVKEGYKEEE